MRLLSHKRMRSPYFLIGPYIIAKDLHLRRKVLHATVKTALFWRLTRRAMRLPDSELIVTFGTSYSPSQKTVLVMSAKARLGRTTRAMRKDTCFARKKSTNGFKALVGVTFDQSVCGSR